VRNRSCYTDELQVKWSLKPTGREENLESVRVNNNVELETALFGSQYRISERRQTSESEWPSLGLQNFSSTERKYNLKYMGTFWSTALEKVMPSQIPLPLGDENNRVIIKRAIFSLTVATSHNRTLLPSSTTQIQWPYSCLPTYFVPQDGTSVPPNRYACFHNRD
jgi:hypothetical protein